jgi:hypothetical protein
VRRHGGSTVAIVTPRWTTAFLDLPPDVHATGTAFWRAITGSTLSPVRGDRGQFATLLPPSGEAFLRVQRLSGAPRVHLDLHVDDLAAEVSRAVGLGAVLVSSAGHAVLRSPGGLTFCLVRATVPAPERPGPWVGPRGGRALVDQVALDVPPAAFARERGFWTGLTTWEPEHEEGDLIPLRRPDGLPLRLLLHRLGPDVDPAAPVRAHLDLAAGPDRAEVVAEHVAAGAAVLRRHERWTVLTDPAGLGYCVTDRLPETGRLPVAG